MKKKIETYQDTVDAFNATDDHTIADAKRLNKEKGQHFFDRSTMKFFGSMIHGGMRRGKYFITSEKASFDSSVRRFTVREFNWETGQVKNPSDFLKFNYFEDAKEAIKQAEEK